MNLVLATALALSVHYPGAIAAPTSPSRLSIHLIESYKPGARRIVDAHPRVLKILDVYHGPLLTALREYKAGTPQGVVVLRVYTPKRYQLTDNPTASAADFWNTVLAPAVNFLQPADRALIDYIEGPNECDSTPCWGSLADVEWFNTFWLELAQRIADAGFKPCAFSIPVGNPPGSIAEIQQKLDRIVPALRKCKQLGGGWSYHSYTGPYTTDVATELWYSLRYRQFYSYFAAKYPDLAALPLILTEGGVDTGGNPNTSGWQAHGSAEKFTNWLAWYDARLREDPYVVGCTLFQSGASGWASFEVEPIADWLAGQIWPYPPGDFNGDNDVDTGDFNVFVNCITGANRGPPRAGCEVADLDHDRDVDLDDFGLFQRCLSGPGIKGDPHCAD